MAAEVSEEVCVVGLEADAGVCVDGAAVHVVVHADGYSCECSGRACDPADGACGDINNYYCARCYAASAYCCARCLVCQFFVIFLSFDIVEDGGVRVRDFGVYGAVRDCGDGHGVKFFFRELFFAEVVKVLVACGRVFFCAEIMD